METVKVSLHREVSFDIDEGFFADVIGDLFF